MTVPLQLPRLPRALGCLLLLAMAGCAQPPPAAPYLATPVALGTARIWFYRDLNTTETLATPYVRLNGVAAGVSEPGGAFYRDVPPGHYRISVDSYYSDAAMDRDVDVAPGGEVYAKVLPLDHSVLGGGVSGTGYHRNNYVVWLYPPEAARPAIARSYIQGSQVAQR
jgi:Protein of unknown function (DUF2846)